MTGTREAPFTYSLVVASVVLFPSVAAASDPQPADACYSAPVEGQTLQRAGKLLDARERFAACARNTCPREIVSDCTRWLGEVEAATPSVVVAAVDRQHRDAVDARVSIDGKPAVGVTAFAIEVDPGHHTFVFRRDGSPDVAIDLLLRQGEKNREVAATFDSSAGSAPEAVPATAVVRPVPGSAWAAAAVGVLGLASFGAFGALGVGQRGSDHCDTGCGPSQKNGVDSKFVAADVSLGVAAVGFGVATWLFFARAPAQRPASALLDFRVLPGGGFASVGSRF
jgi:hypothetical protein